MYHTVNLIDSSHIRHYTLLLYMKKGLVHKLLGFDIRRLCLC